MRVRRTLAIVNWAAAAAALLVFVFADESDYAFIPMVVLLAAGLHAAIAAGGLVAAGLRRRRLAGLGEFRSHATFTAEDLAATLADETVGEGGSLPALVSGVVSGEAREAPLSKAPSLAWRLEAESLSGMAGSAGEALLVDSFWGEFSLEDATGRVAIDGPGILDPAGFAERVYSAANLKKELPGLAGRITDGLELSGAKELSKVRIRLREVYLRPSDHVAAYGLASLVHDGPRLSGNDLVDDPGSLLVRAATRPASSRREATGGKAIALSLVAAAFLASAGGIFSSAFLPRLTRPGGLLDPGASAPVTVAKDGRGFRLELGTGIWEFEADSVAGETTLMSGDEEWLSGKGEKARLSAVELRSLDLANGEPGYPRWDGEDWLLAIGEEPKAPARGGEGRLFLRNLTKAKVSFKIQRADGSALGEGSWTFLPLEGAGSANGNYLSLSGKGAVTLSSGDKIEFLGAEGSRRTHAIGSVAEWKPSGFWRLDLVPELLAGEGTLRVKNPTSQPVKIWILGADGKRLHGDSPWNFGPREGADKNKGLDLTVDGKSISFTGREAVRIGFEELRPVYEGPLSGLASKRDGRWRIELVGR